MNSLRNYFTIVGFISVLSGCAALPDIAHEPRYHNPFPQLQRVAVLPFYNQSTEPTLDGELVAKHYYTELQQIPGFEVVPLGVTRQYLSASPSEPRTAAEFQRFAQQMGVDAVVVGAITEYNPYYPPRMGLAVRWYAANPAFHPIPAGYGLPWGTSEEEYIPDDLVFQAEFELAKEQLKTQTPELDGAVRPDDDSAGSGNRGAKGSGIRPAQLESIPKPLAVPESAKSAETPQSDLVGPNMQRHFGPAHGPDLPPDWPDPRGFVPPPPSSQRPTAAPHYGPVMSHVRLYDGHNSDFTQALAGYYYFRDDARFGGWQSYLQRSDDFIRFCCYMHVTEMLAARGGAGKTRVVWRWPIGRYER